jgi:hypothetical protein
MHGGYLYSRYVFMAQCLEHHRNKSTHCYPELLVRSWAAIPQSIQRLATGWMVRGSNPGKGPIFRTCTDRPRGLPSLLYNGYRVSFPGVKRPGRSLDQPPLSSTQLYLYSPSGASWRVLGWTLYLSSTRTFIFLNRTCLFSNGGTRNVEQPYATLHTAIYHCQGKQLWNSPV